MTKAIREINNCRLCGTSLGSNLIDFGDIPLANNLKIEEDLSKCEFTAPLIATSCPTCGSHQLKFEVHPDILFKNYSYETPPNLRKHFEEYAQTVEQMFQPQENDVIIGIGGNNGMLEHEFIKIGHKNVYNFEPAENIAAISSTNVPNTINAFFNTESAEKFLLNAEKAKIITCNNCFAHIPDLDSIVDGIKLLLREDGVFVFENAYLLNTLLNKDFGQYYSEHIFYHSVKPLIGFFKKHGLRIFDVQLNDVQMGSMRVFVTWENGKMQTSSSVNNLLKLEDDFKLYESGTYKTFLSQVADEKDKLITELAKYKSVVLYGVPAKIVLLINYFGIEKYIQYAVDDSLLKVGRYIPGTKILIKPSEKWKQDEPKATLIGAYNFSDDIIKKNNSYNGKWIVPFK
jgi:hypothetical protein